MVLTGAFFSEVFEYIKLSVFYCSDSSLCHTAEEIAQIVKDNNLTYFKINLSFSNIKIDIDESNDISPNLGSGFIITPIFGSLYTKSDISVLRSEFYVDRSIYPYSNDPNNEIFFNAYINEVITSTVQHLF